MNSDHDIESTEHLLQKLKKIKLDRKQLHAFRNNIPHIIHSSPSLTI